MTEYTSLTSDATFPLVFFREFSATSGLLRLVKYCGSPRQTAKNRPQKEKDNKHLHIKSPPVLGVQTLYNFLVLFFCGKHYIR